MNSSVLDDIIEFNFNFLRFDIGMVVKHPPANAGETGSVLGPGISHMPWGNYAGVP